MEKIHSDQNQWMKRLRALQKRKYRLAFEQFLAEGAKFVDDALNRGANIQAILVAEEQVNEYQALLARFDGPKYLVAGKMLHDALDTIHPQGIVAIVSLPAWDEALWATMKNIIIVDGVQDPGNLGTIIRTALACGVDGVFCLKGTVDISNNKVLRATMGAVFALPIYQIDDHEELIETLRELGFAFVIADVDGEDYDRQRNLPEKVALVVGNEGNGRQRIQEGDMMVKIPLSHGVESLNVAVATGILLYAMRRLRVDEQCKSS